MAQRIRTTRREARWRSALAAGIVAVVVSASAAHAEGTPPSTPAVAPEPGAETLVVAHPVPTRTHVDLNVTLDPVARRITGTARLAIPNLSGRPLDEASLWLYPNRLGDRPEALGDVNFHWLYPNGFSPAAMRIRAARVGVGLTAVSVTTGLSASGRDTIARIPLPVPVPPGGVVQIEVDFTAEIPVRLAGFGCVRSRCRLMGGFYPYPLHLGPNGFVAEVPPDRIDFTARIAVPPRTDVLLGDVYAPAASGIVTASDRNVSYVTLLADPGLLADDLSVAGFRLRFLHHGARPPSSEREVLPYVREDRAGLILEAARRALEFVAEQGLNPALARSDDDSPLILVEAPLRHELVKVHGDVVLISDRLFEIFPIDRLRKFHRLEVVRGVLTAVLSRALRRLEPDPDVDLSTDILSAYLTEVFTLREFHRIEFARDLLRPLSFVPAVDQLMYAPLVASSSSYFGDLADRDVVRDDVRRFSHGIPGGRLVYAKLLDLLGAQGMSRLARAVLGERIPLRRSAEQVFGAKLGWFWQQWQAGAIPRVNYRLARVVSTPLSPVGSHARIEVERQGADLLEPVEVRVVDRAGVAHDLTWTERGTTHAFDLDLPSGIASVEVDPRHRLVESAVGSLDASDDPRADNRDPKRWRLIYSGFGALLDVTALQASFAAAVTLKPQHDLHNSLLLVANHSPSTTAGMSAAYARLFGRQADSNRLTSELGVGLSAGILNPSYGVSGAETIHAKWRLAGNLFFEFDDRDFLIDPWRAVGFNAGIQTSVTGLDSGEKVSQVGGGVEVLRLIELAPGHVLAFDVEGSATFGDVRVRSQLTQIGGPAGLRGFDAGELFGRAHAVAHVELRDRYLSDLDWNIAHFTSVRGFGGNLFFDAGLVSSCDNLNVGRNDVFYDIGYSFRVLHDAFGAYQQMLSIDLAVPLNRHDRVCRGQHSLGPPNMPLVRRPFVVLISFLPSF